MKRIAGCMTALAVAAAGCASEPTLERPPGAMPAPGPSGGVMAEQAGIQVSAWPDEWSAEPQSLEQEVTPLLVRIENNGTLPLRIRFNEFVIRNPAGANFHALPPFTIDETVTAPIGTLGYTYGEFYHAPYLHAWYPGFEPFPGAFDPDLDYYETYLPAFQRIDLPTAEMIRLALPEGVLQPGGTVTGFVYFEDVTDDPQQVTLAFDLMQPTGARIGTVTLPFLVDD